MAITAGRRTDPGQPCGHDGLGEVGALGQEAVAGVHGVAARLQRRADDAADVEVGVGGRRPGEGDGVVGEIHRHRPGVGLAVHDDGLDAEAVARPDHADGDLATIGDEYAGDHLKPPSRAGKLAHVRQALTKSGT